MQSSTKRRFPAEWEAQDAVMLTWPHEDSDWLYILDEVQALYMQLIQRLLTFTNVIIAVQPADHDDLRDSISRITASSKHAIWLFPVPSNDTWARDHGPISVWNDSEPLLLDFTFNGWGNKFPAALDNTVSKRLHELKAFSQTSFRSIEFVMEGGAIESNGEGTLMTTSQCLLNPNRNPGAAKNDIEETLKAELGVKHILWLDHGYLAGDDTDSHIDTLARFAPENVITYVKCDDAEDEHFAELQRMEAQLKRMRTACDQPFKLIPLPWPKPIYSDEGHRLPATYANFLITNGAVIAPTYGDLSDQCALTQLAKAFPEHQIIGLDCRALIKQHGSLHCITMQIPKGLIS